MRLALLIVAAVCLLTSCGSGGGGGSTTSAPPPQTGPLPGQFTLTTSEFLGTITPAAGAHYYDAGTVVVLTVVPIVGARTTTWTGTDNDASTANTNTVTMTSDRSVSVACLSHAIARR
jgi:hypothetical protein